MWPWGHLAFGYLVYAAYLYARRRESPAGWPVVVLAVATQFPDLVDKPLAYTLSILPEGRSLAHSVFALVVVCSGVWWVMRRYGYDGWGVAFAIGYGSHLLADSYRALLGGRFEELTFLLWPVLPSPDYEAADFGFHLQKLLALVSEVNLYRLVTGWDEPFVFQLWLVVIVVLMGAYHRAPPVPMWKKWWASR